MELAIPILQCVGGIENRNANMCEVFHSWDSLVWGGWGWGRLLSMCLCFGAALGLYPVEDNVRGGAFSRLVLEALTGEFLDTKPYSPESQVSDPSSGMT